MNLKTVDFLLTSWPLDCAGCHRPWRLARHRADGLLHLSQAILVGHSGSCFAAHFLPKVVVSFQHSKGIIYIFTRQIFMEHVPCARRHPNALERTRERGSVRSSPAPAPHSTVPYSSTPNRLSSPYARPDVSPVPLPLRDVLASVTIWSCLSTPLPRHPPPVLDHTSSGSSFLVFRSHGYLQVLFWNLMSVVNLSSLG